MGSLSPEECDRRFRADPRDAQLAIHASEQSAVVGCRAELERRLREVESAHAGRDVPRPSHWGAYRLSPTVVELWQGRPDRLHDRIRYRRGDGGWVMERLSP